VADDSPRAMGDDAAAVRQALDELQQAFDRGDVDSVVARCAGDVVFFGSGEGEEAVGREQLAATLTALAPKVAGSAFALQWDLREVDVREDVALLTASGTATISDANGSTSARYRLTGVLVRVDGHWLWRVYHGSEPAAW
jgi:uncharacterized protein (TIGR02246 family)